MVLKLQHSYILRKRSHFVTFSFFIIFFFYNGLMNKIRQRIHPLKIPTSEYPDFSDRLKITMQLRECSVEELAKKTYLSKAAICGYRKGIRTPNLVILRLIAEALHVSSDFLIGLTEYIYI